MTSADVQLINISFVPRAVQGKALKDRIDYSMQIVLSYQKCPLPSLTINRKNSCNCLMVEREPVWDLADTD